MIVDFDQPDPDLACQGCRKPPVTAARFTGAHWEHLCAACAEPYRRGRSPSRPRPVS
ncbi:hypothetical protein [Streptomyces bacillaris]|uniref:hypothetical protein n=1 Tax=Streptomyces bacillaris TaxID=68179 RepID=UPI003830A360